MPRPAGREHTMGDRYLGRPSSGKPNKKTLPTFLETVSKGTGCLWVNFSGPVLNLSPRHLYTHTHVHTLDFGVRKVLRIFLTIVIAASF